MVQKFQELHRHGIIHGAVTVSPEMLRRSVLFRHVFEPGSEQAEVDLRFINFDQAKTHDCPMAEIDVFSCTKGYSQAEFAEYIKEFPCTELLMMANDYLWIPGEFQTMKILGLQWSAANSVYARLLVWILGSCSEN